MRVSVILTVLNEGPGLAELLGALQAQTTRPDEIVIVDGGSRDDTMSILQAHATLDPCFKIHQELGCNIAQGRNIAITRAQGEIIAVTDGGCRPEPGWLAGLLKPLQDDQSVGAVAGLCLTEARSRFEHYAGHLSMPSMSDESQHERFYGRSSAFRRSVWAAVRGYPEWLYTGEDTLFAIATARLPGSRIVYAPDAIVHWRPRSSLRKLGKMFYLYGVGNGRIQNGDLGGCLYWLKFYVGLAAAALLAAWQPWLLLVVAAVAWHLWRHVVRPNLSLPVWAVESAKDRFWYVPMIALTRNLTTNAGYLRGWLDYRRGGPFKQRHEAYLGLHE